MRQHKNRHWLTSLAFVNALLIITGCATNALLMPSNPIHRPASKSAETFQAEDESCRHYAEQVIHDQNTQITATPTLKEQQRHYDMAYEQCMAAQGNPLPANSFWNEPSRQNILYMPPTRP